MLKFSILIMSILLTVFGYPLLAVEFAFHEIEQPQDVEILTLHSGDLDDDSDIDFIMLMIDPDDWYPRTDGTLDLILFQNNGRGEFESMTLIDSLTMYMDAASGGHSKIETSDIDSDGDLDIATVTGTPHGRIIWLENLGDLEFTEHVITDEFGYGFDIRAGDIDMDEDTDFLVTTMRWMAMGFYYGYMSWFENDSGEYIERVMVDERPQRGTSGFHVTPLEDLDGDEDLDFYLTGNSLFYGHSFGWVENDGEGHFTLDSLQYVYNYFLTFLESVDFDRDGDIDLLRTQAVPNNPHPGIFWHENALNDDTVFYTHTIDSFGVDNDVWELNVADFDLDGNNDVISLREEYLHIQYNVLAEEERDTVMREEDGFQNDIALPADIDGDGDIDIFWVGSVYNEEDSSFVTTVGWLENDHFNSVDNELILHPSDFILYPAYPNPFNSSTVISYSLDEAANVELRVLDIGGRLIDTVVSRFSDAGNYRVSFDGTRFASGNYIVELKSRDRIQIEKMVLVR